MGFGASKVSSSSMVANSLPITVLVGCSERGTSETEPKRRVLRPDKAVWLLLAPGSGRAVPVLLPPVEVSPFGVYRPQDRACNHSCRTSVLRTQKNKKMKNPWKELKTAKSIWKTTDASLIVNAAKTQVRPNRNMMPSRLNMMRMLDFCWLLSFTLPVLLRVCLIRITMTVIKMAVLNRRMANMGPRKAPKNTLTSLMKQLKREREN